MHYRCEIVMPPVSDIEEAVTAILAPFNERLPEDDENGSGYSFWDFWVIGGRYAGSKLQDSLDSEKLELFWKRMKEINLTVSGFCAGKQEIKPAAQIPRVDAIWRELFPESGTDACPLFAHSNDQYSNGSLIVGDVCSLKELPEKVVCARAIIAGPDFDNTSLCVSHMEQEDFWNGVNYCDTTWDKTLQSAIERYAEKSKGHSREYLAARTPKDDWLVVTVDYHS